MVGEIVIRLPYPYRIGFITVSVKRRVGFSFDQRAIYNLIENNEIDLPDYKKWMDQVGNSVVIREMLFAAACSYAEKHNRRKWVKRDKLTKGFIELPDHVQKSVLDAWTKSESFGYKEFPGKKKAKANR